MNDLNMHFVISAPRSGSTWLSTALNHHPELFATEHRLFGRFCEIWKNNNGTMTPRITSDSYARAFGMHYFYGCMGLEYESFVDLFQAEFVRFLVNFAQRHAGKRVVVDKVTPYAGTEKLVVGRIRELFPEAKLVQLVRDGRDVLTSGTFDWLLKDAAGTARHDFFVNHQPGKKLTRFFDDAVIQRWASTWLETIDAFRLPELTAEASDDSSWTLVRYESMQENLASELIKLFRVFGVDDSQEIATRCEQQSSFRVTAGREPGDADPFAKARKGAVGDWKNYFTRADGELFERLAGRGLVEMGYESSGDWVANLPEELNLVSE